MGINSHGFASVACSHGRLSGGAVSFTPCNRSVEVVITGRKPRLRSVYLSTTSQDGELQTTECSRTRTGWGWPINRMWGWRGVGGRNPGSDPQKGEWFRPCMQPAEESMRAAEDRRGPTWTPANEVVTVAPWCAIASLYVLLNWWLLFTLDHESSGRKAAGLGFVACC